MTLIRFLIPAGLLALAAGCSPRDATSTDRSDTEAAETEIAGKSDLPKLGAAPAWRLQRPDGTTVDSSELNGKVVVVDFWATWCGPCLQEIPGYIEIQKKYADRGLEIVGISMDQRGPSVVERFAQQHGVNYTLVMGDEAVVEAFGGIEAIPTTFLIDRDGQIRHRKVGAMEREDYEPLVASLL